MGILTAECDDCGEILKQGEDGRDYDGTIRCAKCACKDELYYKVNRYKTLRHWLKKFHVKELVMLKKEISVLNNRLKLLCDKEV